MPAKAHKQLSAHRPAAPECPPTPASPLPPRRQKGAAPAPAKPAARSKLSYKDQRELDALPARIDALEQEQKRIHERLASNALYTQEPQLVPQLQARNEAIEEELMAALERWEALGGA